MLSARRLAQALSPEADITPGPEWPTKAGATDCIWRTAVWMVDLEVCPAACPRGRTCYLSHKLTHGCMTHFTDRQTEAQG